MALALATGMLLEAGSPANSTAATLVVGRDAAIATIAEAARLAQDGDIVEILPGDYRGDVTVWLQKRLTIRGVGGMPVLKADNRSAEGKAIWVLRSGDFVVENIAFEGARVPDGNGAGIRFERGRLTVRRCRFTDNENGLLTSNFADSELTIEDSEFARAPRDRGGLKHLLYVGRIGRFTLTGSRFHQGFEGHLVKTRARENHIMYNLLYDGTQGKAAYELEFPDAGEAYVVGNVIGQSATTTNPAVVSYGAEGSPWERNALYLVNNTLASDPLRAARFLHVHSDRLPGDTEIVAINNLMVGLGIFTLGTRGRYAGNFPVLSATLADPAMLNFRVRSNSILRGMGVAPPIVDGRSLAPTAEFHLPVGAVVLAPRATWTPGAFQSTQAQR
jgi:hypothetical protein